MDIEERARVVGEWSRRLGAVILLKGRVDVVSSPSGTVRLNETGNPGMTVGGTGDVLAGVLASLVAQGMDAFNAACCAAFINGYAGDMLLQEKGYAFTALELAEKIPYAIRDVFERFGVNKGF